MTDFALKFTDKETFDVIHRAIFDMLAPSPLEEDEPTPHQGLSLTGTHWFVDEIGPIFNMSDPENPEELEGHFVNLRWNGGDDEPLSNIPGMEIVWRSDAVDEHGDPVPRPDWWSQIIA